VTEAEWLACTDPQKMLEFLQGKAGDRKLRLFAVACCRGTGLGFRLHTSYQDAVELAERHADGASLPPGALAAAAAEANRQHEVSAMMADYDPCSDPARLTAEVDALTVGLVGVKPSWDPGLAAEVFAIAFAPGMYSDSPGNVPRKGKPHFKTKGAAHTFFLREQAALLHDIFGNPFRPVALNPAWLAWQDGTIPRLAQASYEDRGLPSGHLDPARLAVLADALEEAGCDNQDILSHLRGPGPHVRGCWALDLVLGRT
jgi:hypothetical protein